MTLLPTYDPYRLGLKSVALGRSQDFREMAKKEKQIARKELFLELRSFKTQSLANFMYDLDQILKTNKLDPNYNIVFKLLRNHQFCHSNTCYALPIFNVIDDFTI